MMALTALSIDIMLVALPEIDASYSLQNTNDRQYVITAYLIGFAIGQPFSGTISDRFGRKPVLYVGIGLYIAGAALAAFAPGFAVLLAARVLQGLGASAPRVIGIAVVRDLYAGRGMSRVMSFVMMVFIIVPIIAPIIGAGILLLGDWHWIFGALLVTGVLLTGWIWWRLPETLAPENRIPLQVATLKATAGTLFTNRQTLGYTVGTGFIFGNLMAYIGSAEQIFVETYRIGDAFPFVFGAIAAVMIPTAIFNARLVERAGMRRMSHAALVVQAVVCLGVAALGFPGDMSIYAFCGFLAVLFICFGLIMPNFNALAMEPLGRLAGTGSSFVGFYSTAAGALFGAIIGQLYDGSVQPILIGFSALSFLTLIAVLVTERGRLFDNAPEPLHRS